MKKKARVGEWVNGWVNVWSVREEEKRRKGNGERAQREHKEGRGSTSKHTATLDTAYLLYYSMYCIVCTV